MLKEEFYIDLKREIEKYFSYASGHGMDHTLRVYNMCLNIARNYNLDIDVLKISALLHDIARLKEDENRNICHATEGAKMARNILLEKNIGVDKINKICKNIEIHRYSKGIIPETIEGKILQDSDRLDALGATIIARVFNYSGAYAIKNYDPEISPFSEYIPYNQETTAINHFYEKTFKMNPETFHTKEAKEFAKGRYDYAKKYVERYIDEYNGRL